MSSPSNQEIEQSRITEFDAFMSYVKEHCPFVKDSRTLFTEHVQITESIRAYNKHISEEREAFCRQIRSRIEKFLNGRPDPCLEYLLDAENSTLSRLPFKNMGDEELIVAISQIGYKDYSFRKAVKKQHRKGMQVSGIEKDRELCDLIDFLQSSFTAPVLEQALVASLHYKPNVAIVHFREEFTPLEIPARKFMKLAALFPFLLEHKVRAKNFASTNEGYFFNWHYYNLPIFLYSFVGEDPTRYEYLEGLPKSKRRQAYKRGTVIHEIGHMLYASLMGASARKEWKGIVLRHGKPLTFYSAKYLHGAFQNTEDTYLVEEFCEALRLFLTVPDYLDSTASGHSEFLHDSMAKWKESPRYKQTRSIARNINL